MLNVILPANTKLLSMLFSPRVILFIVIGIGGFIMAVTFIGYYWCYLRYENSFQPKGTEIAYFCA